MNKPKKDRSKIKRERLGVALSAKDKETADRVAFEQDITTSELVRKATRQYCEEYYKKKEEE